MKNRPYKITLDTNCIVNVFDNEAATPTSAEELACIIEWGRQGLLDLAITTRVEVDQYNDSNEPRKKRIWDEISKADIKIIAVPGTYDNEAKELKEEITRALYPKGIDYKAACAINKTNDIEHLVGHKINQRDIFITDDGGILKKKDALEKAFAITVMSPKKLVDIVRSRVSCPVDSKNKPGVVQYVSPCTRGCVRFNYSNNSGYFRIGHGIYVFDTEWTKAGNTSIYAYNDAETIDSIARVTNVRNINDLRNLEQYDFSSRYRTIKLNEILILKNSNGFYAALKVLKIQDDSRGDDEDLLEFEYVIDTENVGFDKI